MNDEPRRKMLQKLTWTVDVLGVVVDVEEVCPPAPHTLLHAGLHQPGLRAPGGELEQRGVQPDDDRIHPRQPGQGQGVVEIID